MQGNFFDIGVNLTHESFNLDYKEVLEKAFSNNIKRICLTGTSILDSKRCLEIAEEFKKNLITTIGIHPHYADSYDESAKFKILELAESPFVKAIGETGLDFNRNLSLKENQIISFVNHIQIANNLDLPLFLHQRDAHQDFMHCITKEVIPSKGVVHCFTGSISELYDYLDQGLYIGITGWLCDPKRGKDLEKTIPKIPIEKLMIETDSPYLLPKNIKTKNRRNEPYFLPEIFNKIYDLRSESKEVLQYQIYENSVNFFNLNE